MNLEQQDRFSENPFFIPGVISKTIDHQLRVAQARELDLELKRNLKMLHKSAWDFLANVGFDDIVDSALQENSLYYELNGTKVIFKSSLVEKDTSQTALLFREPQVTDYLEKFPKPFQGLFFSLFELDSYLHKKHI